MIYGLYFKEYWALVFLQALGRQSLDPTFGSLSEFHAGHLEVHGT